MAGTAGESVSFPRVAFPATPSRFPTSKTALPFGQTRSGTRNPLSCRPCKPASTDREWASTFAIQLDPADSPANPNAILPFCKRVILQRPVCDLAYLRTCDPVRTPGVRSCPPVLPGMLAACPPVSLVLPPQKPARQPTRFQQNDKTDPLRSSLPLVGTSLRGKHSFSRMTKPRPQSPLRSSQSGLRKSTRIPKGLKSLCPSGFLVWRE